jgi:hypothetical protein
MIYLLLIIATTIIYFTPPFERRWDDHFRCYAIPVIVTIHWLVVKSGGMLFKTMAYLWLFTTFYYVALHTVVWAVIAPRLNTQKK